MSCPVVNLRQTHKAPAVAQFSLGVQHELSPSSINRQINSFPINIDMNIRCNSGDGINKYSGHCDIAHTLRFKPSGDASPLRVAATV